ncbi:cupin domain-containing protein [Trinickia mobilis]|uniref:cupin domain-containing protein n=1 Tax=Trinickia mobilis TaxID=2816356 RepID=UPI001A8F16E3|nr:AraC family transcriptional regulator [Trinickia mobilis]
MPAQDWLSHLLEIGSVAGRLEFRCVYGTPWRVAYPQSPSSEIPYHVVLKGSAVLEDGSGGIHRLTAGDIVLLPNNSKHVLHDGSGIPASPAREREQPNLTISENDGTGERLEMLCGHFVLSAPNDRLIRGNLPPVLVVHAAPQDANGSHETSGQMTNLIFLMRAESLESRLGGRAMLNALSTALFALTLRLASESAAAQTGLLALAGHPRLAPAITAMFDDPARAWNLPQLARLCNMSRATFMRHFQDSFGRSAYDLLTDLRMSLAANALSQPSATAEAVAEAIGYQSVSAFRRAFTQRVGVTPGEWRRSVRGSAKAEASAPDYPAPPRSLHVDSATTAAQFADKVHSEHE